jgi:hypothetical protein
VEAVGQGIWGRRTYGKLRGLYTDFNIVADTEKKYCNGWGIMEGIFRKYLSKPEGRK